MDGRFTKRFIPDGDQIISKTYMTRVEGENTRLRHYLARLHRKTLCYSKYHGHVETFAALAAALSQIWRGACAAMIHTTIQQRQIFIAPPSIAFIK
ncbi:MAG: hypothetical protein N4J56_007563 [Chroococcidiopsis sp. SAG 2025]|nr:hypothetical protein [Chroococcidiopsis sp. SAG 2025]